MNVLHRFWDSTIFTPLRCNVAGACILSDTIWVDVEGRGSDQLPGDHSIMHRLRRELDDLCAELGVVALSGFYDYSALADQHGQDTDRHSKSWFDPVPALQAIRAISDYLELHPERLDFQESGTDGTLSVNSRDEKRRSADLPGS